MDEEFQCRRSSSLRDWVGNATKKATAGAGTAEDGPASWKQVEARIAAQEEAVADLERKLADDWGDLELLTAHRAARDELQSLLDRWETLFEQAQATP